MCVTTFNLITLIISVVAVFIAGIAMAYTRKQYLTNIKPELWNNVYSVDPWKQQVKFVISNRGYTAQRSSLSLHASCSQEFAWFTRFA